MTDEVKEVARLILQMNFGQITELAKGLGEMFISKDDEPDKDISSAVGGVEPLREALFYWAESVAS